MVDEDALLADATLLLEAALLLDEATLLLDEAGAELLDDAGATELLLLLDAAGADVGAGGSVVGVGWAHAVATMPKAIRTKSASSTLVLRLTGRCDNIFSLLLQKKKLNFESGAVITP